MESSLVSKLRNVFFGVALFTSGCGNLLSPSRDTPDITYPDYVKAINLRADKLAKDSLKSTDAIPTVTIDTRGLETATELYLSVGNLKKAEESVSRILDQDPKRALYIFEDLQEYRDAHPNQE